MASVVTQSLSTVAEITTFGFSTVEPTSSQFQCVDNSLPKLVRCSYSSIQNTTTVGAVSNVSETNSNVTGEQKIDLTAATKPVESTAEPTEAISSTGKKSSIRSIYY